MPTQKLSRQFHFIGVLSCELILLGRVQFVLPSVKSLRTLCLYTSFQGQAFVPTCCCNSYDIIISLLKDLQLPEVPLFLFVQTAFFSSFSSLQFSNTGILQLLTVNCFPTWLFAGEGWLVVSGSRLFYKFCMFMCRHFRSALNHPTCSRGVRQP